MGQHVPKLELGNEEGPPAELQLPHQASLLSPFARTDRSEELHLR